MNFISSKPKLLFVAMSLIGPSLGHAQNIELGEPIPIEQPKPLLINANTPIAETSNSVLSVVTGPEMAVPKTVDHLIIRNTERLMPTLKKWLADQNIELVWAANASTQGRIRDVVFEDDFESSSSDLNVALTEALSPFAFEAEISTTAAMRRVTVRNLRNTM